MLTLQNLSHIMQSFMYYLSPGPIIILISYFVTRKMIRWHAIGLLALILPFIIWMLLMLLNIKTKTLSNFIELRYLSFGVGFISILSIFLFRYKDALKPTFDIVLSVLLAVIIYFAFPMLKE